MQIDFGEKWIVIGGTRTKTHLFVAVLGYSRRIFVRASLLIDRAGALVIGEDRESGVVRVHPAFAAFCRD